MFSIIRSYSTLGLEIVHRWLRSRWVFDSLVLLCMLVVWKPT